MAKLIPIETCKGKALISKDFANSIVYMEDVTYARDLVDSIVYGEDSTSLKIIV